MMKGRPELSRLLHAERKAAASSTAILLLDWLLGCAALLTLAPVMALIALAIYAQDGGPVIFAQRRMGWRGRSFLCFKFRTMCLRADERLQELLAADAQARAEWERDHKLRSDPRVTPVGRILRKLSLDELPQLFNVLRGDMSLVGPRPIIAAEADRYGSRYWTYCLVRPGITGLWQISGRNDIGYRRRVAMDVLYIRRLTLMMYLRVLVLTAPALVMRRGAY